MQIPTAHVTSDICITSGTLKMLAELVLKELIILSEVLAKVKALL